MYGYVCARWFTGKNILSDIKKYCGCVHLRVCGFTSAVLVNLIYILSRIRLSEK